MQVFRCDEKISNVRNISKTIHNFRSSFEKPDWLVFKRSREEIKQIFNSMIILDAKAAENFHTFFASDEQGVDNL